MGIATKVRQRAEFLAVIVPYHLIRLLPYPAVKAVAVIFGNGMNLIWPLRKLVRANIHTALPELSAREVARIGKKSFINLARNLFEFFWLDGNPDRIRRCYHLPAAITGQLKGHVDRGERIIFVNPHLGSWEASGVMAPFYAGVNMVAIAKPMQNPLLNELLNNGKREKIAGLHIIFAHGAIRAALKALREGRGVGTLIDQNTRVRDGGVFVDFFGLPVPSSTAPANLKEYCDAHHIPSVIIYGTSVRHEDGRITAHSEYLSKPFDSYKDATEVLQELMKISESYIRRYPDQYLWLYKRFQYIPPQATPEQRARYPYYAAQPGEKFYHKQPASPVKSAPNDAQNH